MTMHFEPRIKKKRRGPTPRKSPYTGVSWHSKLSKWLARLAVPKSLTGKAFSVHCGYWDTDLRAAQAINEKCAELGIKDKNFPQLPCQQEKQISFAQVCSSKLLEPEAHLEEYIHRREDETYEQARIRNWKRLRKHRETKTFSGPNVCERCRKPNSTPMLHPSMTAPGIRVCFQCLIQEFVEPKDLSKKRKRNPVHNESVSKRFKPNLRPMEIPTMQVTEEVEQASSNLEDLPPSRHIGISYNKCSKQYVASYQLNRENRYVASGRDYDEVLRVLREDHARHAKLGHRVTAKIGTLRKPFATMKKDKRQPLKSQLPQSPYIGVSWSRRAKGGKWHAAVNRKHVGYYDSQVEAALAVNARCKELGVPLKNPQLEMSGTKMRWIAGF